MAKNFLHLTLTNASVGHLHKFAKRAALASVPGDARRYWTLIEQEAERALRFHKQRSTVTGSTEP